MILLKNATKYVIQKSISPFRQFAYKSGASIWDAILKVTERAAL